MSSRIKGVSLINTLAILREVLGGNRFQALVSTCPPETQQLIRRTLVAGEWIPVEVWAPFIQAIFEHIFHKDEVPFRRLLRAVCKRDFNTVYRQHVAGASPEEVLDKAGNIFSAYFDSGSLTRVASPVAEAAPSGDAKPLVTLQMRDLDTNHVIYAMAMHAYLEQVLAMSGAPYAKVTRSGEQLRDGKLGCDFVVDFDTPEGPVGPHSGPVSIPPVDPGQGSIGS